MIAENNKKKNILIEIDSKYIDKFPVEFMRRCFITTIEKDGKYFINSDALEDKNVIKKFKELKINM